MAVETLDRRAGPGTADPADLRPAGPAAAPAAGREPPVLELCNVAMTFQVGQGLFKPRRPLHAVRDVSLRIGRGEVLGLVGESGCGKSTLAKILLGLQAPTAGDVLVDGDPMIGQNRTALARRIQPIFQDPYSSLNPRKTVGQIVGLPLSVHKVGGPATWRGTVEAMLDIVGLPKRVYDSYANQLSGGQRQRVAIARALVMRPEIVICDEPTSALDVSVQSQILNLLIDLREEFGLTYLFISHNLAVVEHIATRVAVMYLGRIVEDGPVAEIFDAPGHPYTRALLDSVLTPDPTLSVPDNHLGATYPNPLDLPPGCSFNPRCIHATDLCRTRAPVPVRRPAGGIVECHHYDP